MYPHAEYMIQPRQHIIASRSCNAYAIYLVIWSSLQTDPFPSETKDLAEYLSDECTTCPPFQEGRTSPPMSSFVSRYMHSLSHTNKSNQDAIFSSLGATILYSLIIENFLQAPNICVYNQNVYDVKEHLWYKEWARGHGHVRPELWWGALGRSTGTICCQWIIVFCFCRCLHCHLERHL